MRKITKSCGGVWNAAENYSACAVQPYLGNTKLLMPLRDVGIFTRVSRKLCALILWRFISRDSYVSVVGHSDGRVSISLVGNERRKVLGIKTGSE